jgi:predicted nucleotidyltransferase
VKIVEIKKIKLEMAKNFGRVFAACLYGSQACGYAKDESNYDVLVILDEYEPGVK